MKLLAPVALAPLFLALSAAADPSLQKVRIPNDVDYWRKSGFSEMVLPVHEPTDSDHSESIRVWLKVPDGQKITATWISEQNRYVLTYPPGTIADRVDSESSGGHEEIDDVRGARIDDQGETTFHVYETAPGKSETWLQGYEWNRGNDQADVNAGKRLLKLYFPARDHWYSFKRYHWSRDAKTSYRRHNLCGACHIPNSPPPASSVDPVTWETDSRGFFQPSGVLRDSIAVRDHRDWDLNADDPFITVSCNGAKIEAVIKGKTRGYSCPGTTVVMGTIDLASALAGSDPHAAELCQSRKYLFQHMTPEAQEAYRARFDECGIR